MKNLTFSKVSMSMAVLALLAVFSLVGCGGGGGGGGTTTTSDTTATSPLKDAAWSLNTAGRNLTTITWVNSDGVTVQSNAYSGEAEIIVDPAKMTLSDVQTLVSLHQGTIYAQLPAVGLYWVTIAVGSEASFIAAIRSAVTDVFPVSAITSRQTPSTLPVNYNEATATAGPISVSSGYLVLDDFTNPECLRGCDIPEIPVYILKNIVDGSLPLDEFGNFIETTDLSQAASHGDIVSSLLSTNFTSFGQSELDVKNNPSSTAEDMLVLASGIKGATDIGEQPVFNYSRGPIEYEPDDPAISEDQRTNWEVYNQNNAFENLEEFSAILNADVSGAGDTIIVQAAGNSGTNLTSVLVKQQTLHPSAAKQIVEVGALGCKDDVCNEFKVADYSNYSTATGTMIYVPVNFKTNNGFTVDGTSYAAPQIMQLISQIRTSRPDLTPDQIRQVLFDPSVAPVQNLQLPDGTTLPVPVINDPLCKAPIPSACVLQTAIGVANGLFPTSTFTLTIATAGTGSGTVTSSPIGISCGATCSSYASGTSVTLAAMPSSGSTFAGWSGACSGTGSCVVTMDADKTVTATFSTSTALQEIFTGPFSGSFGNATGNYGCQWSLSFSGTMTLTITQNSDGTINGSGSVPINIVITTTFSPSGVDCTVSPSPRTATGPVSGTNINVSGTFSATFFNMNFTGTRNGNSILGSATASYDFIGTGTSAQTSSISNITLTKQ